MNDREQNILHHVALYGVSFRPILAKLFFAEGNPDRVLADLRQQGLLRTLQLPGGKVLYRLTRTAAALIGVPEPRARKLGTLALHKAIAVLLFCLRPNTDRIRLEQEELGTVFSDTVPEGTHCLERHGDGRATLYHVYAPADPTAIPTITRKLRRLIHLARARADLCPLVQNRQYAFAVAVDNDPRRDAIRRAVQSRGTDSTGPLVKDAKILVETLADPFRSNT